MKNITLFLLALINITFLQAQVGVGTLTPDPTVDLHVAGDLLVQGGLKAGSFSTVTNTEEDFKLLARVTNSNPVGELKVLDTGNLTVPPITIIKYRITNINRDNVNDLNLGYATSKYIVGVSNFRQIGDPMTKLYTSGGLGAVGDFRVRTFESGSTWHLECRNILLDLPAGDALEYEVSLVIYDKKYFRALSSITTDLGGSNSGNASSIPVLN